MPINHAAVTNLFNFSALWFSRSVNRTERDREAGEALIGFISAAERTRVVEYPRVLDMEETVIEGRSQDSQGLTSSRDQRFQLV